MNLTGWRERQKTVKEALKRTEDSAGTDPIIRGVTSPDVVLWIDLFLSNSQIVSRDVRRDLQQNLGIPQ